MLFPPRTGDLGNEIGRAVLGGAQLHPNTVRETSGAMSSGHPRGRVGEFCLQSTINTPAHMISWLFSAGS